MSTVSLTSYVQCAEDNIAATIDDEIVILSIERGSYYGLDDIGRVVWERLATPMRVDILCDELETKYDADRSLIQQDVLKLLESLVAEGLVSVTN